jgi:hypothetical protein
MSSLSARSPDALAEALRRAVAAGTLSADQAEAVLAAERSRAAQRVPGASARVLRLPLIEALGYLGGLLAVSGAVTLAVQYWPQLSSTARLVLLAVVAVVTWLVGARISDAAAPALVRLRGALWLASSAAVAGFAGQFSADVFHAGDAAVLFWVGAAVAGHAGLLWRCHDRPLQHLACLAGVIAAVGGAADLADGNALVGLAIAAAGAGWVLGGWYRLLPPPTLALLGGGAAVLTGAGTTAGDWPDAAPLIGLAAAAGLTAAGVGTNRTPLIVVGLTGGFIYLPWTVGHFFADSLGIPVAMVLCGVALLALTLVLLRRPSAT